MENLRFGGAFIPRRSDIEFCVSVGTLPSDNEQIWCIDNTADYKDSFDRDIYCHYYSKKLLYYGFPNFHTAYEIYPMLSLLNLKRSDFCVGETFNIKGLPFYITNDCSAIATKSIGSFAWEDDEYGAISNPYKGGYIYNLSSLHDIVQDWFDYFIKN
jgi:hypothetical protein